MFFQNFNSHLNQSPNIHNKVSLYDTLHINKDASDKQIKSAYRRLAKECHPDKYFGDTEKEDQFKLINEAYEVLSDTHKRQKYDMFNTIGSTPTMPFECSTFNMSMDNMFEHIDPNVFQSVQSNILNSIFGIQSVDSFHESSDTEHSQTPPRHTFEAEIFNSIHNLFGIPPPHISPVQHVKEPIKMPTKELIVDITLAECYICAKKTLTINRNILNEIHQERLDIDIPLGVKNKQTIIFVEKGDVSKT